jgi:putative ABC transport system permease protein
VAAAHPGENEVDDVWLESRQAYVVGDTRPVLLLVAGAVGLLLALACANLINLLLVRATSRERELAIRAALGAGRGRLAWPLLSESLMLAALGGLLGVGLASLLIRLLLTLEPGTLPRRAEIGLDVRVLGFAMALTLACAILCGLLPALRAGRRAPAIRLREGGGSGTGRSARLQVGFAVAQVTLAMVLLVGAGLLGHSLYRLLSVPTGFEGESVLTAHIALPAERYTGRDQVDRFYDQLLGRLEGVPGVEAVGATWALPFSSAYAWWDLAPADADDPEAARTIVVAPIRGDFFRALGMSLLQGRGFGPADNPNAPPVAVVNQTLARTFWPDQDAVGKRLRGIDPESSIEITVVGVVADVKRSGLDVNTEPEAYLPQRQTPWASDMFVAVRASGDPRALTALLRDEVLELDPALPVTGVMTLAERVSESVASPRFRTAIVGGLAVGAALVALIGIYGVLSFVVEQRQREMALRVAVGAQRAQLLSEVLASGLRLTLAGLALGTVGAVAASRALRAFLFEVDALDPLTFAGVAVLFLAAATLASYMPARRAAGADPMVTLRQG